MADKVTLTGTIMTIETDEGKTVERSQSVLDDMFRSELLPITDGVANPDGTKFIEHQGPLMICAHQQPPHVRQLRWIAKDSLRDFGPGTKYRKVRLSFPYTITLATFVRQPDGNYVNFAKNELYFSLVPIISKDTPLFFPALLNISVMQYGGRSATWICTEYLQQTPGDHWTQTLEHLLEHTWNGAFNRSSERHEGASWYGKYKENNKITPVENWQEATSKDDAFGMKIEWQKAGKIGDIMNAIFNESGSAVKNQGIVNRIVKFAKV